MIKIENLTTGYKLSAKRQKVIHENLNAQLKQGQLISLIGANGAGKSTLIKTLGGFIKPLAGTIEVDEQNINNIKINELAKKIGVVMSNTPNIDNSKTYEVVAMGRYPYSGIFAKLSENDYTIIEEAITTVGIEDLKNLYFNQMSDGERQKVMIAKILAQQTPYIIMDEPMAYLDYPSRLNMMSNLKKLTEKHNKSILISTHNLEMVIELSDLIWIVDGNGSFVETDRYSITKEEISRFFDNETAEFLIR